MSNHPKYTTNEIRKLFELLENDQLPLDWESAFTGWSPVENHVRVIRLKQAYRLGELKVIAETYEGKLVRKQIAQRRRLLAGYSCSPVSKRKWTKADFDNAVKVLQSEPDTYTILKWVD